MTIPPADMTLDELREALAPLLPGHAAFDGWNEKALASAAAQLGVPAPRARLAFPGGAIEMIDAWFAEVDRAMTAVLPPELMATLKIRERIIALVVARLETLAPHREALRRALAVLAFPTNAVAATRFGWRAADAMWRLAGDRATDFAHYTKRMTLAAVYAATLLVFLDDESDARFPRSAYRRRDALREVEGAIEARSRAAIQPRPLLGTPPLSGRVSHWHLLRDIDNHSQQ
jgi:ubiquinone biosynthesis protein COQ9